MRYEYKMVQVPPNIVVKGAPKGQEAAYYLQELVNKEVQDGWEFYRLDTVGVVERPGCLGALLGQKATYTEYYIITFRRPKAEL